MELNKFKKMKRTITNLLLITLLVISNSCSVYHLQSVSTKNLTNNQDLVSSDNQIITLYTPFKDSIDKEMQKVIAISETELVKGKPESYLTNFISDLLLEEGKRISAEKKWNFIPDVSYQNYGGLRVPLPKGEITIGNIYELMPFENEIVFLNLTGIQMTVFLDQIAAKGGDSVSGVKFGIKGGKAVHVLINGAPPDPEKTYWLVTNDYVAEGGDEQSVLTQRLQFEGSGEKIRDVIIKNLEKKMAGGIRISPVLDGRIYNE